MKKVCVILMIFVLVLGMVFSNVLIFIVEINYVYENEL